MPRTSFDQLAKRPEYRKLLRRLEEWVQGHQRQTIDPRVLARAWPEVRGEQLAIALQLLVKAGTLRQVYKVLTPNGVLVDEEFDDPRQIPSTLPDRSNRFFDTSEADVLPVFKAVPLFKAKSA
jgi:hypothetical protein